MCTPGLLLGTPQLRAHAVREVGAWRAGNPASLRRSEDGACAIPSCPVTCLSSTSGDPHIGRCSPARKAADSLAALTHSQLSLPLGTLAAFVQWHHHRRRRWKRARGSQRATHYRVDKVQTRIATFARGSATEEVAAVGAGATQPQQNRSLSELPEDGLSRRTAAMSLGITATLGALTAAPLRAIAEEALALPEGPPAPVPAPQASLTWLPMDNVPEEAEVFGQIESSPEWSLDFVIYLARILLNYDDASANWWEREVLPLVERTTSKEGRGALLRERFAEYAASVEFGLRRYVEAGRRTSGVLKRLVRKYGQSEDGRRHLALAFTLLEDQPLELIASLLNSLTAEARLQAVFSPALTDYLAMDPRRLLPYTQYPVWDGGLNRWVVPGLRAARPYGGDAWEEGFAESVFGPRANELVFKERQLRLQDYGLFALSGAFGCAITHSLVIPLDVVKTRMQTTPGRYSGGLVAGAMEIQRTEGTQALLLGWEPTILGYLWYGVTVYPGYEFFKRTFFALAGQAIVESFRVPLVLLAGAAATVIACFGVCPAEACRIRMVADEGFQGQGLFQVVNTIAAQDGVGYFYDGLSTILVRQVLFGMMKFLVFDYFADFILDLFPILAETVTTQLFVSLFSGAVAGVVSSIVSQPADTVLSKMNREGGRKSFVEVGAEIYREQGLQGFFLGLGSRCVWAGCIISGQFFLYDVCKSLLGVKDLRMFLDVQI